MVAAVVVVMGGGGGAIDILLERACIKIFIEYIE